MSTETLTLGLEPQTVLILHNIRSAYNVGSMFRTADGMGVNKIYLTGYSPAPASMGAVNLTAYQKMIAKTALGAERTIPWKKVDKSISVIRLLKKNGFEIVGVEQNEKSIRYTDYQPKCSVAIVMGNEVRGIDRRTLKHCDQILEIPMHGMKNSLNVSVALGIVGYQIAAHSVQ